MTNLTWVHIAHVTYCTSTYEYIYTSYIFKYVECSQLTKLHIARNKLLLLLLFEHSQVILRAERLPKMEYAVKAIYMTKSEIENYNRSFYQPIRERT